jgi:hypothetical protein
MTGRITHALQKGEAVCVVPSQPKSTVDFFFWPVLAGIWPAFLQGRVDLG